MSTEALRVLPFEISPLSDALKVFSVVVACVTVGVVFFAVLFVAAVITTRNNLQNQTAVMELPFWLFMAPLAAGSLLLTVETLAMLIHTWRRRRPEEKQTVLT